MRGARDRIAIEEEEQQQIKIHRHQQLGAPFGGQDIAGQGHRLADADHRGERRRDGEDRVEVHPGRRHPLHALRQDDHPQRLPPRHRERFRRLPLRVGNRAHRAAHQFGHVRHHRQREPDGGFEPARQRHDGVADAHFERQQQHAVEQQHQPRRVAEELRHEPRRAAHRRQQRDLREPQRHADHGADRHREEAHRDVEREALQQQRRPFDHRRDDAGLAGNRLRLRLADADRDDQRDDERHAVPHAEAPRLGWRRRGTA